MAPQKLSGTRFDAWAIPGEEFTLRQRLIPMNLFGFM
jgi:hypothetical protein